MGSGLTMVDVALVLGRRLRNGVIHVRSRHGLLPAAHTPSGFAEFDNLDLNGVNDARTLLHRIRETAREAERHGSDWRNVVSALRSRVPAVWAELPLAERSRLLRHVQRYWEVHRHRMSPRVAKSLDSMIDARRLNVGPGRVEMIVPIGERGRGPFDVTIATRSRRETLRVGALVDANRPMFERHQFTPLALPRHERGGETGAVGTGGRSGRARFACHVVRLQRNPHQDYRLESAWSVVRIDGYTGASRPSRPNRFVHHVQKTGSFS